jgi:hypothetical protein
MHVMRLSNHRVSHAQTPRSGLPWGPDTEGNLSIFLFNQSMQIDKLQDTVQGTHLCHHT